ncbi:hypothetical protein [Caballeronia sordidicola]|uniref:Uncharacterized protein n=1 Tax=Caballeronia sordidicola TaxID=196367 RepID=A0A242M4N4_CABSO|nr:hypothetical protein [Caballeronia sordidicola]OTP66156.1 hypothetical protein PAMC26510_36095 [Caballeronia sordidicola]
MPTVSLSAVFIAYLVLVAAAAVIAVCVRLGSREATTTLGFIAIWLVFGGWMGVTGIVGRHANTFPPGIALLTLPVLAAVLAVVLTRGGAMLAEQIPLGVLIGFQVFRVGVEMFLHRLWSLGLAPKLMTLEGGNIEIVVAVTAPVAAWLASRDTAGRRIAWAWNVIGIISLANIVARAVLTAPGPLRLIDADPPDTAILMFPYTFIPGFFVPLALALHILAFRAFRPGATKVRKQRLSG